jgi:transketolase
MYDLPPAGASFEVGKARLIRAGNDVCFVGTGETVIHCLLAASQLEADGLHCSVLSMPTVKPLDRQAILAAGRRSKAMVTVEEHSVHGGLGEACAAELMQAGVHLPLRIVGFPDQETVTGSQADLFRHYGISMEGLVTTARGAMQKVDSSA